MLHLDRPQGQPHQSEKKYYQTVFGVSYHSDLICAMAMNVIHSKRLYFFFKHCVKLTNFDRQIALSGKYQNCHLVLKGSSWFFLVLILVLFSSVFGSLVLFQFSLY